MSSGPFPGQQMSNPVGLFVYKVACLAVGQAALLQDMHFPLQHAALLLSLPTLARVEILNRRIEL